MFTNRLMVSVKELSEGGKSADISDEWIEWWSLLHRRLLVLQVALFIGYGGGGWGKN